jgi:tripartite-type tricarboxylate transporter receptor subunit TctC
MAGSLGKPVVIENRPGGGQLIGVQSVVSAEPDGHTLLWSSNGPISLAPHLQKVSFDPVKDLMPVSISSLAFSVVAVNAASDIKSFEDLIKVAKATRDGINYSVPGASTQPHIVGEILKRESGSQMVAIPYPGTAPAMNALLAGTVHAAIVGLVDALPHAEAGKVRILAIVNASRSSLVPDVPTLAELGFPNATSDSFMAVYAPAGTPDAIVRRLNAEVRHAAALPEIVAALGKVGAQPTDMTVEESRNFVVGAIKKWGDVIAKLQLRKAP